VTRNAKPVNRSVVSAFVRIHLLRMLRPNFLDCLEHVPELLMDR
jgi:hypothetical protein